ncbi:MAG: holo-ACP synthase [Nitrospirae bacterium]|nr:holo-ACP synthase [Nitrospirota bacterium]
MRLSQGIDIVNVDRLRAAMDNNAAFVKEIFTEEEQLYCLRHRNPHVHFAGRFAAKEAFLKAAGTGFLNAGIFREIEVMVMPSGRPSLRLSGWAVKLLKRLKAHESAVSISHTPQFAVSSVIIVSEGEQT